MKMRMRGMVAALLAVATASSPTAVAQSAPEAAPPPPLVIQHATVLPMDGTRADHRLTNHTVLVREGRIAALGSAESVEIPAGARRIDGRGKFVVPGLADMHVHFGSRPRYYETSARLYAAHGVTTVLDMNSAPELLAFRERIDRGDVLAPTVLTMARIPNGGSYDEAFRFSRQAKADVRSLARLASAPRRERRSASSPFSPNDA